MRYALFITSMLINDQMPFDADWEVGEDAEGIFAKGLSDEEIAQEAMEDFHELIANDGPPTPFIVSEDQLAAIEQLLPKEKAR